MNLDLEQNIIDARFYAEEFNRTVFLGKVYLLDETKREEFRGQIMQRNLDLFHEDRGICQSMEYILETFQNYNSRIDEIIKEMDRSQQSVLLGKTRNYYESLKKEIAEDVKNDIVKSTMGMCTGDFTHLSKIGTDKIQGNIYKISQDLNEMQEIVAKLPI
ncbi:MAG: hypothetical protein KJ697_02505 [Nanoarchaeota archaeon]|nr:hypothetical protein [Nanoarchaeota archaeon]MBU4124407.1 hypothetical protein [Nanoarchaeota archaeon]